VTQGVASTVHVPRGAVETDLSMSASLLSLDREPELLRSISKRIVAPLANKCSVAISKARDIDSSETSIGIPRPTFASSLPVHTPVNQTTATSLQPRTILTSGSMHVRGFNIAVKQVFSRHGADMVCRIQCYTYHWRSYVSA